MPLYFIMLRYVQTFHNPYLVTSDINVSVLIRFSTCSIPFHAKTPTVSTKAPQANPVIFSLYPHRNIFPPHVPQIHSLTGLPHATHVPFFRLGDNFHISHASASSVS